MQIRDYSLDELLDTCEQILRDFNVHAVMSLNADGIWVPAGEKIRDRISNELWFAIWQQDQRGMGRECLQQLIRPIVRDNVLYGDCLRMNDPTIQPMTGTTVTLSMLEVLYLVLEYHIYETIGTMYVPDWDYQGNARRKAAGMKMEDVKNRLYRIFRRKTNIDRVLDILGEMQDIAHTVCGTVIYMVSEEDKALHQLGDIITQRADTVGKKNMFTVLSEHVILSLHNLTDNKQALLRPCIDILLNKEIAVATGLQYEASSILSALRDPRSAEALRSAVTMYGPEYTNIRCNVIYALGCLGIAEAVDPMIDVIMGPDYADVYLNSGTVAYKQTLNWEKREAIWSLGKCGIHGLKALDVLTKSQTCDHREYCIALAWTLTQIGQAQRKKYGGIDANIMIKLTHLLTHLDPAVFEEVAYGLRSLGLPDFLHALYLHNIKTIPVLALKSSSQGLYELSETILHLVSVKHPIVLAVTGDSGTGKTYFCNAIIDGFGKLQKEDIAYFMRDNPQDMYVFNRMLGIKLLKELRDPQHYEDYPFSEDEDDPDSYFVDFMRQNERKKLIILDGWMDRSYFYQVMKFFYSKGHLDVMVNFRTSYSTKRFNLEERERVLDSVQTCLTYVEDPALEDTPFYRNGEVLVYNLDNSSSSRLQTAEIREVFSRQKVGEWVDYIRVGSFDEVVQPLTVGTDSITAHMEQAACVVETINPAGVEPFVPSESHFNRRLSDAQRNRHLLETVRVPNIDLRNIALYTQGQIACSGYDGTVGILSGLNDRIFHVQVSSEEIPWLTVVAEKLFAIDVKGNMSLISFDNNDITKVGRLDVPLTAVTSDRDHHIITGHHDGCVILWDTNSWKRTVLNNRSASVNVVAVDRQGNVYSGHSDGTLCVWHPGGSPICVYELPGVLYLLNVYPDGRVLIGAGSRDGKKDATCLMFIDLNSSQVITSGSVDVGRIGTITAYSDGRVFAGVMSDSVGGSFADLIVCDPGSLDVKRIGTHGKEIRDCVIMGPQIITCGTGSQHDHDLKIWGTARYTQTEREKLQLLTDAEEKPSYYRTLF